MSLEAISAYATAGAAIFTALMAGYTRKAIKDNHRQNVEARGQSERHHQDSLRPLVVLTPLNGIEPADRSKLLDFAKAPDGQHLLSIACELRNIGTGPALNPRMHLRAMGIAGYGFTKRLSPIRAGQLLWDLHGADCVQIAIWPSDGYNSADIAFTSGTTWQLVLEYEDVFGKIFHTIHGKDSTLPWTVCGIGSAPTNGNRA